MHGGVRAGLCGTHPERAATALSVQLGERMRALWKIMVSTDAKSSVSRLCVGPAGPAIASRIGTPVFACNHHRNPM